MILSWLPRGPFLVLAGGALLLVLLDTILGRKRTIPWSIPTLVVLIVAFVRAVAGGNAAGAGWITVDRFSTFVTALVCVSAALAAVLSEPYLRRIGRMRGDFFALLLFSSAGMVLFASSTDLLILFLGLELLSIPVYILSGFSRRDVKSGEAALKYFLLGAFSSAILLLGIAFVYGAAGTTELTAAVRVVPEAAPLLQIGYLLLLVGFLFKVAAVPFHMWTPDVYEGAPTTVTAFMATGVKAAAFAALLRVLAYKTGVLAGLPLTQLFWWLAVLTMTVGNLAALTQSNIKRMLAYSSIAHAGYILVGVTVYAASGDPDAISAILYYLLAYTFMTIGAFAVVVAFGEKDNEHLDMGDYGGLGWRYPAMGIAMSVFMIALSGIPPTAGFFGKYAIFRSAVNHGQVPLVVIAVLNSALSVAYYLRVMVTLYMRPSTLKLEAGRSLAAALVVAVCVFAILWAGFGPDAGLPGVTRLLDYARASVLAAR
jgi:NADH-quinone oxidoreductase subunit N